MQILDPTHEADAGGFALAARLAALQGATVGIISNGKKNTIPFFDAFETELKEQYGVAEVVRRTKSNYSAPADAHIMAQIPEYDLVFSGLGD